MRIEWLADADHDFEAIIAFISQDNPIAAVEQGDEILDQISGLETHPQRGRKGRVAGTRELVIIRTPYIAVYRLHGTSIQILRILHSSRKWP